MMRRLALAVWMIGGLQAGAATVPAACVATAREAVRVYEGVAVVGAASVGGYRVVGVRRDDVLPVAWAQVERCGHPDWPALHVAVPIGAPAASARPPAVVAQMVLVVRAGETVRVWRQDQTSRLEMAAVSEEAGALGVRIRLRVARTGMDGEPVRYVFGLVRGPADVEME